MSHYFEVIMPRMGVNDETVTIVEWLFMPGDRVQRGDILANTETTKAAFELECEQGGFFYPLAQEGAAISIRGVVALILDAATPAIVEEYIRSQSKKEAPQNADTGERQITERARALVEKHQIDISGLPTGRIVRERDVLALIKQEDKKAAPPLEIPSKVVVYGASQGGLAVVECIRSVGEFTVVAFLDDGPGLAGTTYHDIPVWPGKDLEAAAAKGIGAVATHIANAAVRYALRDRALAANLVPMNVVHAKAVVASTVQMGTGNLIKAGAVLDAYVELGDCCIIDNGVILPHHNKIGSGCHISPGACFGGDCEVGDNTIVGIGATVSARTRIGKNVIIGVGSCIARDIPDNAIVEGFPARIVGERKK